MLVLKTLRLFRFFGRWSAEELFKVLGEYEPDPLDGPATLAGVISRFDGVEYALLEPVDVYLIQRIGQRFTAKTYVLDWMKTNGFEPMQLKHTMAIGLQLAMDQVSRPIWMISTDQKPSLGLGYGIRPLSHPGSSSRRTFTVDTRNKFYSGDSVFGAIQTSAK